MLFGLRTTATVLLAAAALGGAAPASAQPYPSRTVTVIVPFSPGGTGDIVARVISEKLGATLGQSIVVENRAGAAGTLGTRAVVAAAPDGHTLLLGQTGEIAIAPHWSKSAGYDANRDLQPIALATVVPLALVAPGKAPYATVAEMLKAATGRGLSFASAGAGTPGHFAGEVLKHRSKANLAHVPYKGAGPTLNDLLGGHIDFFFSGFPAAIPYVQAGKLTLLAVSTSKRSGVAPDVPTVAEAAGIADFDIALWQGFFAPRNAAGSRRAPQWRDQSDHLAAGRQGQTAAGRCRRETDVRRPVCPVRRRGGFEVRPDHQGHRPQVGLGQVGPRSWASAEDASQRLPGKRSMRCGTGKPAGTAATARPQPTSTTMPS
jgi:tripartite-type tricarboxylate transporter receptor subunit TctC